MAEWKKVLVSGSDIEVRQITASGLTAASKPNLVVYDTQSGAFHYTSSTAVGGSTTYQTGSGDILNLDLFKVVNYDSQVFVTSSNGTLTIQFGTPAVPTNLVATLNTTATQGTNAFNTDRFSGPGAGVYVVDAYDIGFTYITASSNTIISASLLQGTTIVTNSLSPGGSSTTFNILTTSPYASGSQSFTCSLHIQLQDGSKASYNSNVVTGTLAKTSPNSPTVSINYTGLIGGAAYVSNNGASTTTTSNIENGVTGSITYTSASGTTNGWTLSTLTSPTNPSPITVTATGSINQVVISGSYTSNGLGTPSSSVVTTTKSYSRITSLRSGAAPNSASFTEAELLNLTAWTGGSEVQNGTINFNTGVTSIPSNTSVTITNSTSAYLYIIYGSSVADLTNIRQGPLDVTSNFTKTTVGLYKIYRTTFLNSPGVNTFTLNAT
jgi:hypothetical protein